MPSLKGFAASIKRMFGGRKQKAEQSIAGAFKDKETGKQKKVHEHTFEELRMRHMRYKEEQRLRDKNRALRKKRKAMASKTKRYNFARAKMIGKPIYYIGKKRTYKHAA